MSKQIIAPEWSELPFPPDHSKKVIYPTIAGVPPLQVKKVIDKIPEYLWKKIADPLRGISSFPLDKAYRIIHGIEDGDFEAAKRRLAYQHFFDEQIKIILRRNHNRLPAAPVIKSTADQIESLTSRFPYALTIGQRNSIAEILKDLNSSSPMMRLLQGDVGCGKSTVAFIVSKICIDQHFQVAYMGPTEALVLQQFNEAKTLFPELSICLLTGGLKNSEKKIILDGLSDGSISYIFGTHALFQKEVQFKNLGMIIIDEQHKFGVRQRLSLGQKAKEGVHCLTMTATPIPRSLCLTQYGDLDISTIQTIPEGRRGQKTRIVTEETFESFLRFLKTRLTLGEQAYIVAPAIQESVIDIHNVESISERFKKFFPEETIATIHGKLNAEEKTNIFLSFQRGEIQILIATSVIEVGINVPNATVMAILNPERFGLSSLHQLRGRVGRGSRPGFCFLICEGNTSNESLARLKIIEQHNDGFKIAEEDLKIRGRGDLFGIQQSGSQEFKLLTDFVEQDKLIEQARKDAQAFIETHGLELFNHLIEETVTHTF